MEKQVSKEPNSLQMIDARAAKLTAVIGYPRDRATITQQIGPRRTNHERAFCYRYDYKKKMFTYSVHSCICY